MLLFVCRYVYEMYVCLCVYLCVFICVNMAMLVSCRVCRGQRTASGVSPWLPPCLRQSLSLFQCLGHASWSMTFWTVSEAGITDACAVSGCNVGSEDLNLVFKLKCQEF